MPIPKYDEIQVPAMQLLQKAGTLQLREFEKPLAEHFQLKDEEVAKMYDSGNAHIFYDRISWALSYLHMAGLVDKPKRGVYQLSQEGRELLQTPERVIAFAQDKIAARNASGKRKKESVKDKLKLEENTSDFTPQEKLYASFENIRKSIYQEILTTIISKTPTEFEKLVVKLLQRMGYGGEVKDAGMVTSASNDGGIDGIIKEDILGLGRIHIQAKRFALDNCVGRDSIQKFVGALAVAQSNKGVFITTSYFSKGAIEYAQSLNGSTTVVLIDGEQLAQYIYDFGLGMQVEQTIEIKKLDTDFWDSMMDVE